MWANNEIGTVSDIPALAAIARSVGVPLHTDAVQAVGQVPVDFGASGADALTMTGHKLGGPMGAGVLLLRRDAECTPLLHGGGQERDVRSGTLDVAAIVGLEVATTSAVAPGPSAPRGSPPCATGWWRASSRPSPTCSSTARRWTTSPVGPDACPATRTCPSPAPRATRCSCCWTPAASSAPPARPAAPGWRGPATCCWRGRRRRPGAQLAAVQPRAHLDRRGRRRGARRHRARGGAGRAGRGWAVDEGARRHERGRGLRGRRGAARSTPATTSPACTSRCRRTGRPCAAAPAGAAASRTRTTPAGSPTSSASRSTSGTSPSGSREDVVDDFVAEYAAGRTPEPLPALQREDQVLGRARPGLRARLRRRRHRAPRPPRPTASSAARWTRPRTSPTCSAC